MLAEVYSHPVDSRLDWAVVVVVVIISGKRISVGSSEDPAFFIYDADAIGRVRGRALVIERTPPLPTPPSAPIRIDY